MFFSETHITTINSILYFHPMIMTYGLWLIANRESRLFCLFCNRNSDCLHRPGFLPFDIVVRKSHNCSHMKKKMKKPVRSIYTAQTASYLLIILVISATFSLFFFSTAKNHLEREVGQKLKDIAAIAARNAPVERLELIKAGDDRSRMVLRLKEKLGEIQEATGVANIIIFRPDRTSLVDLRPDYPIGTVYVLPHFDESIITPLKRGEGINTGSYKNPSGKLYISAYAPVLDGENRLFAIVGVHAGTREVEVIEQMRTRLYFVAGVGVLLAFLLALVLARTLSRPISGMATTAQRIGRGDYEARVPVPSFAELGVLADSINEMALQVQRRDGQLKEMSASVAHEIRNPLNSIKLLVTLLGEELQDQEGDLPKKTLQSLHYEIGKLNRFLTEFLTYSRPITLTRDRVAPGDLARNAADMARAEADEKGVTLRVSTEPGLPDIRIDRERMEQSLLNLIINAVHESGEDGFVDLKIRKSNDGEGIEFVVEDAGPGMDEEAMERLFEPFFTTKQSGTGLGLSNAEKIVKSHGGILLAENIPTGGARFIIRLPLNRTDAKEQ